MADEGVAPAELGAGARALRTPRAAGVAGILFALLLGSAMVLLRVSTPAASSDPGTWLTDPHRRGTFTVAMGLIPFAGIAFLWFMGVVRDHIGEKEDRFIATVFMGSGLLFVAMLFVGAAVAGAIAASFAGGTGSLVPADTLNLQRRITHLLLNVFALRMAAVFVISTTTIAFRTGILPKWLGVSGYAVALILLVTSGNVPWVNLVFPLWTLALSIEILVTAPRRAGQG